jgi:hypothetical protein
MLSIEEIINIPDLLTAFADVVESDQLRDVMDEIIVQSKVEFNYQDDDDVDQESTDEMIQ